MDNRIAMGCNHVGNLKECASRSVSEWTRIAEGTEETSAVTGRDHCEDCR